jgi:hypothetical protein
MMSHSVCAKGAVAQMPRSKSGHFIRARAGRNHMSLTSFETALRTAQPVLVLVVPSCLVMRSAGGTQGRRKHSSVWFK